MKRITSLYLLLCSTLAFGQQTGQLTGTITDEEKVPIEHATVQIKGLNQSTFTNTNGYFQIKNQPEGDYLLEVRHVGTGP